MEEVLSGFLLLWMCRKFVYCLKVCGFSFVIFFSVVWDVKVFLVLWCVMIFCVSDGLSFVICVRSGVEVVFRFMLIVFMVFLIMVFSVLVSWCWFMLCWYWLMLMDLGGIFISLVSGFCKWWVMDIVLCSDMFSFGNFFVVSLDVE